MMDVKKPLLVVRSLDERGNMVQFGPWQNYIMSAETGKKIMMERKGGSFVIDPNFAKRLEGASQGFPRRAW